MHMRADAEETSAVDVFRTLGEELLDCSQKVEILAAGDDELLALWRLYVQVGLILCSILMRTFTSDHAITSVL